MKSRKLMYSFIIILTILFSCIPIDKKALASDLPSVTTDYQMLSGEITSARISVENKDIKSHTYSLRFGQLPEGFQGYFSMEGKVIDSLDLSASQKSIIYFFVDVPSNTTITDLSVSLNILREDGVKEALSVSYTLNGDYAVSILSNIKSIKVINGDSINLEIGVTNTGNKELANLNLQVDSPYKWILENVSPTGLNLKSGDTGLYKIKVTVPSSQQSGEYPVKISCSNAEVTSNPLTVPVTVSTNVNYLWWIAGPIVILLVFTLFYFKKHGRR